MNIKQVKSNFGDNIYYMKLSRVKGKNLLLKNGWKLCSNPNFLTNGANTGHYNKGWIEALEYVINTYNHYK